MQRDERRRWVCDEHGLVADPAQDGGEDEAERLAAHHLEVEHADVWKVAGSARPATRAERRKADRDQRRRRSARWN